MLRNAWKGSWRRAGSKGYWRPLWEYPQSINNLFGNTRRVVAKTWNIQLNEILKAPQAHFPLCLQKFTLDEWRWKKTLKKKLLANRKKEDLLGQFLSESLYSYLILKGSSFHNPLSNDTVPVLSQTHTGATTPLNSLRYRIQIRLGLRRSGKCNWKYITTSYNVGSLTGSRYKSRLVNMCKSHHGLLP